MFGQRGERGGARLAVAHHLVGETQQRRFEGIEDFRAGADIDGGANFIFRRYGDVASNGLRPGFACDPKKSV